MSETASGRHAIASVYETFKDREKNVQIGLAETSSGVAASFGAFEVPDRVEVQVNKPINKIWDDIRVRGSQQRRRP